MLGLLQVPLAIRLIEYLARLAPEMTTETEILDQGVVHLDQGEGSLSKRKDELVVCLPAIPTWRCPGTSEGSLLDLEQRELRLPPRPAGRPMRY